MKSNKTVWCTVVLLVWVQVCPHCHAVEPILTTVVTVGAGLGLSAVYAGWNYMKCQWEECCNDRWVKANFTGLEKSLLTRLHGQPLVHQTVVKALKDHSRNKNPKKALVLSFHGWTGGGKNYVSNMVAENLYRNGMKSKYVQLFVATKHFPHQDEIGKYKKFLQKEIESKVKECPRSLFIFDEIDKMPHGLIDIIKPFLDFHQSLDGVDYRKSTFIFLSNTAGDLIARATLSSWKDGVDRNKIKLKDMEHVISLGSFNEKGGLYQADIVEKNLIDVFVPFLPLERRHIKLCAQDDLRTRGIKITEKLVEDIADELEYIPSEYGLYSTTGCKKVHQKVTLHLQLMHDYP